MKSGYGLDACLQDIDPTDAHPAGFVMSRSGHPIADGGDELPLGSLAQLGARLAERPYARRGVAVSSGTIRVMLVDDHTIVREGLRALLAGVQGIQVVGEAGNGPDAVRLAGRLSPDVVIMDLHMPGGDGATATRALSELGPMPRVLVLTIYPEDEYLIPLLEAGARGFLSKDAAERDLVDAIRVVAAGDVYVRPCVARRLASLSDAGAETPSGGLQARYARLSDRERSVLRLVAEGYNGPEVAQRLGINAKTVDTYKQRIEEKLHICHRSQYVRFALSLGLLGESIDQ